MDIMWISLVVQFFGQVMKGSRDQAIRYTLDTLFAQRGDVSELCGF